jgi:hypothetical protein
MECALQMTAVVGFGPTFLENSTQNPSMLKSSFLCMVIKLDFKI